MHHFFYKVYCAIVRRKLLSAFLLLLFVVSSLFWASKITFNEDIQKIIPKSEDSALRGKVLSQLDFSDKIVIVIEKKNEDIVLSEVADDFIEEAQTLSPWIESIGGQFSPEDLSHTYDFIQNNLPIFLNSQDFETLSNRIHADSIAQKLNDNISQLTSPSGIVMREFIEKDPLGFTLLGLNKLSKPDKNFTLIDGYLHTQNQRQLLLFLHPKYAGSETENNVLLAEKLNSIEEKLNAKYKGKAEVFSFGAPLIAVVNAQQIKRDIQYTVILSTGVLFLLLIVYFRSIWAPILIFIPTILGALGGLAVVYFFRNEISAISLSVSAILVGITIDYAIHILTHYKNKGDVQQVFRDITQPILMSASTTGISFLCLLFVRSEALKDLGIFACATVILSAVFTLLFIPVLYTPKARVSHQKTWVDKLGAYPYEEKKWLRWACLAVVIMSFFGFQKLYFNNNLSELNFISKELRENEKKLSKISHITQKSIYVVAYGNDEKEVLQQNSKLYEALKSEQQKGKILSFSSSGGVISSHADQQQKIEAWNQFWTPEKRSQTLRTLEQKGEELGYSPQAFAYFEEMFSKRYTPLSTSDFEQLASIKEGGFVREKDGFYTATTLVKIEEKHRLDFLQKFDKKEMGMVAIDRQRMNEDFLALLKEDFSTLVNYSVLVVVLIFYLFFRNIDLTIIAVVPILLSGVVTAGLLYFLGLELNIFSTIVCSLIFGAGVDFNIFLTQAMQKELTTGEKQLPLYRVSIILALLTTVLAIGVLVFAEHPALYSVSSVAMVGLLAVTLISFALYPLFFQFIQYRIARGQSPVGFRIILFSAISFLYYGVGATLFSASSPYWIRGAKVSRQLRAKKLMKMFLISVLHTNPFVRKRVINPHKETFENPVIIIANHTSFLDTLALAMVSPKFVYMVNDWVYHSPVFGKLVRALGFFPASMGIENGVEQLREKVKEGYSIVIFPEGKRSETNAVNRFHKGAFFLAEEFNLPIVPIYIHGNSEVLPKNDYMTYDGAITVVVGERIAPNDHRFGSGYKERTKKINRFFREEFQKIRFEQEDENYFRKDIMRSFLFKEREVVRAVQRNLSKHLGAIHALNRIIPHDAKILHIAHQYGELDVLLTLLQAKRKIVSYIENPEQRQVAQQNHYLKTRKISLVESLNHIPETEVMLIHHDMELPTNIPLPNMLIFPIQNVLTIPPVGYTQSQTVAGYSVWIREVTNAEYI